MEQKFVCSLCLFLQKTTPFEEQDNRLTVIEGQMVCGDHHAYVPVPKSRMYYFRDNHERLEHPNN